MNPFLVRCLGCTRTWHSHTMADGLRSIGTCPRCGGELEWAEGQDAPAPSVVTPAATAATGSAAATPVNGTGDIAPHLVLGLPRRDDS